MHSLMHLAILGHRVCNSFYMLLPSRLFPDAAGAQPATTPAVFDGGHGLVAAHGSHGSHPQNIFHSARGGCPGFDQRTNQTRKQIKMEGQGMRMYCRFPNFMFHFRALWVEDLAKGGFGVAPDSRRKTGFGRRRFWSAGLGGQTGHPEVERSNLRWRANSRQPIARAQGHLLQVPTLQKKLSKAPNIRAGCVEQRTVELKRLEREVSAYWKAKTTGQLEPSAQACQRAGQSPFETSSAAAAGRKLEKGAPHAFNRQASDIGRPQSPGSRRTLSSSPFSFSLSLSLSLLEERCVRHVWCFFVFRFSGPCLDSPRAPIPVLGSPREGVRPHMRILSG